MTTEDAKMTEEEWKQFDAALDAHFNKPRVVEVSPTDSWSDTPIVFENKKES